MYEIALAIICGWRFAEFFESKISPAFVILPYLAKDACTRTDNLSSSLSLNRADILTVSPTDAEFVENVTD